MEPCLGLIGLPVSKTEPQSVHHVAIGHVVRNAPTPGSRIRPASQIASLYPTIRALQGKIIPLSANTPVASNKSATRRSEVPCAVVGFVCPGGIFMMAPPRLHGLITVHRPEVGFCGHGPNMGTAESVCVGKGISFRPRLIFISIDVLLDSALFIAAVKTCVNCRSVELLLFAINVMSGWSGTLKP